MIKLERTTIYKDGGTEAFLLGDGNGDYLNEGFVYCLDNRLFSETKGCWYAGYPEPSNGNIVASSSELAQELNTALLELRKIEQVK
jgi:hypothetical protein